MNFVVIRATALQRNARFNFAFHLEFLESRALSDVWKRAFKVVAVEIVE
jgi:hypothetical protein